MVAMVTTMEIMMRQDKMAAKDQMKEQRAQRRALASSPDKPAASRDSPAVERHDDVIKWNHFPRYWPFVRGIHRSPVNSSHKDQWRGALMLSFIYAWINGWINNREAGDLRRRRDHYDVIVIAYWVLEFFCTKRGLTLGQLGIFFPNGILFSDTVPYNRDISLWTWSGTMNN